MSPLRWHGTRVNLQFGSVVFWLILQQQGRKTQAGATAAGDWLQVDVALAVTFFFFLKHIKVILHMHMFL